MRRGPSPAFWITLIALFITLTLRFFLLSFYLPTSPPCSLLCYLLPPSTLLYSSLSLLFTVILYFFNTFSLSFLPSFLFSLFPFRSHLLFLYFLTYFFPLLYFSHLYICFLAFSALLPFLPRLPSPPSVLLALNTHQPEAWTRGVVSSCTTELTRPTAV